VITCINILLENVDPVGTELPAQDALDVFTGWLRPLQKPDQLGQTNRYVKQQHDDPPATQRDKI
jgi:hypothetical protein